MKARKTAAKTAAGVRGDQPSVLLSHPEKADADQAPAPVVQRGATQDAEDDAEQAREAAFNREGYEWHGLPLIGLTSGRWSLFVQQRAAVTDLPFLDAMMGDGWFADAIRILYFCATEPKDWAGHRRDSLGWQEEIERWADQHVPLHERIAAEALAFQIYQDSNINRHVVAPPEKGAGAMGN